jgi:hypothetical protein
MRRALLTLAASALLAACTQFPELDSRTSRASADTPYPTLVSLGPLLARAAVPGRAEAVQTTLAARAAALRARANALRGRSVMDGATRLRLLGAIPGPTG